MEFQENISLSNYSNLKVGGPARYFKIAKSKEELRASLELAKKQDLKVFILGGGTNILWSDNGYHGLVLKPEIDFYEREENDVVAGSSVLMSKLVDFSIKEGLAGLDWAGGLPGTLGGAVFGNAGCFGGEIKDSVLEVESLSLESLDFKKRDNLACEFKYRDSIFKSGDVDEIIVQVRLGLNKGKKEELLARVMEQKQYREEHQPLDRPNIGSFFKNVRIEGLEEELVKPHRELIKTDPFPVIPAAHLIYASGLQGLKLGGAEVSSKHPNFLINTGDATTADFLGLMEQVKQKVKEKFGIELEEEVRVIE
ncbi:UDP-N-acetylmuramate dehydrogenase [Patescibacteria group bacterium]|nr:UDP-N-acetylmuramate dehydrogenase [Patescibacteria group bacterium]